MRRKLRLAVLAACILASGVALRYGKTAIVHAQAGACDASTFSGPFGYTMNGSVYDGRGYVYLLGAAGRLTADGTGNLSGSDTFSFDGTVGKRQYTGTYTINADCTGSLTMNLSGGNSVTHADFVLINNANQPKEVHLVQTDVGFIVTALLKQQGQ